MTARSQIVGRATCPECGFHAAHVKQSERCLYRYCPECHSQHFARTARQVADLKAKTRALEAPAATPTGTGDATPTGAPAAAAPAPAAPAATGSVPSGPPRPPAPAPKRSSLFGF